MDESQRLKVILAAAMLSKDPSLLGHNVKEVMKVFRDKALWNELDPPVPTSSKDFGL